MMEHGSLFRLQYTNTFINKWKKGVDKSYLSICFSLRIDHRSMRVPRCKFHVSMAAKLDDVNAELPSDVDPPSPSVSLTVCCLVSLRLYCWFSFVKHFYTTAINMIQYLHAEIQLASLWIEHGPKIALDDGAIFWSLYLLNYWIWITDFSLPAAICAFYLFINHRPVKQGPQLEWPVQ